MISKSHLESEILLRGIRHLEDLPLPTSSAEIGHVQAVKKSVEHFDKPGSLFNLSATSKTQGLGNRLTEDLHVNKSNGQDGRMVMHKCKTESLGNRLTEYLHEN